MRKKAIWLTVLGLCLALLLSGCFNYYFEVEHNPDGSGKLSVESILTAEYLNLIAGQPGMGESYEDILARSLITQDNVRDDPNIKSITENRFTDPATGALHHILEIEIIDIFKPLYYDQEDEDIPFFEVEDNGDGSFLFKTILNVPSDYMDNPMMEQMPMDPQTLRTFLQGSDLNWQLSIDEFIEGDPLADFSSTNKVVTWQLPIFDVLFGDEPIQIFTIYQLETTEIAEPEPEKTDEPEPEEVLMPTPGTSTPEPDIRPTVDFEVDQPSDGLFGLPNRVLLLVVAALCLGGILLAIAAAVIILVVRKKKQNQDETQKE